VAAGLRQPRRGHPRHLPAGPADHGLHPGRGLGRGTRLRAAGTAAAGASALRSGDWRLAPAPRGTTPGQMGGDLGDARLRRGPAGGDAGRALAPRLDGGAAGCLHGRGRHLAVAAPGATGGRRSAAVNGSRRTGLHQRVAILGAWIPSDVPPCSWHLPRCRCWPPAATRARWSCRRSRSRSRTGRPRRRPVPRWSRTRPRRATFPPPRPGRCPCRRTQARTMAMAERLRFSKMHGAGNDFVVLDLRDGSPPPDAALAARLADRHRGVGCDQILTIEPPRSAGAVAAYRIWNADGSLSGQCGNGARCVAAWLVRDGAARGERFVVDSPAGIHQVQVLGDDRYAVDMGAPRFAPAAVPLAGFEAEAAEYALELDGRRVVFGAVSMGNPHAVIEVGDVGTADVAGLGAALQASPAFPQSVNVGFAQVLAPDHVRLRVYERGVGETL